MNKKNCSITIYNFPDISKNLNRADITWHSSLRHGLYRDNYIYQINFKMKCYSCQDESKHNHFDVSHERQIFKTWLN